MRKILAILLFLVLDACGSGWAAPRPRQVFGAYVVTFEASGQLFGGTIVINEVQNDGSYAGIVQETGVTVNGAANGKFICMAERLLAEPVIATYCFDFKTKVNANAQIILTGLVLDSNNVLQGLDSVVIPSTVRKSRLSSGSRIAEQTRVESESGSNHQDYQSLDEAAKASILKKMHSVP